MGRQLEMQAAEHAVVRKTLIVLHKVDLYARLAGEVAGVETLEEIAAGVAEDAGLDDEDPLDGGRYYLHLFFSLMRLSKYWPYWFLAMG